MSAPRTRQPENLSVIAVTNRSLSVRPYEEQIARICCFHPAAVIVREKICRKKNTPAWLEKCWPSAVNTACAAFTTPIRKPPGPPALKKFICLSRFCGSMPARRICNRRIPAGQTFPAERGPPSPFSLPSALPSIPWRKPRRRCGWAPPI